MGKFKLAPFVGCRETDDRVATILLIYGFADLEVRMRYNRIP